MLSICEYASSSLYIYTDRNPFSNDGECLKANKEPHCTVVITQTTACAWPGYMFTYQSPSQFNLEFLQKGTNLFRCRAREAAFVYLPNYKNDTHLARHKKKKS